MDKDTSSIVVGARPVLRRHHLRQAVSRTVLARRIAFHRSADRFRRLIGDRRAAEHAARRRSDGTPLAGPIAAQALRSTMLVDHERGLPWRTKSTSGDSSKGPKLGTRGGVTSCGAET
jgi:hypothetical protein